MPEPRSSERSQFARIRVLIVEDNRHFARILKTMLRSYGIKDIFEAEDSFAALEVLADQDIDLMITDLSIPGISGFELIHIVRSAGDLPNPSLPILVVSASADKASVLNAMKSGADDYAIKPISAATLGRKVRNLVSKAQLVA